MGSDRPARSGGSEGYHALHVSRVRETKVASSMGKVYGFRVFDL